MSPPPPSPQGSTTTKESTGIHNNNDRILRTPSDDTNVEQDEDNKLTKHELSLQRCRHSDYYYRYGLFIVSCLYIFFYIGAFFGWGQMQLLLEYNRHFSTLCSSNITITTSASASNSDSNSNNHNNSDHAVCTAQTNALIRVQLVAQTVQIMSPLFGYIVDQYGGKCGYYILTITLWCGLILLVITTSLSNTTVGSNVRIDRLLYVVFILLSTAVSFGGISMIQTGMIFFHHPRTQQRVISTLNSLFDAGAITYLILYQLYETFQISIVTIFSTYLGVSVVLLSTGIYFWNVAIPDNSLGSRHTENSAGSDVDQLTPSNNTATKNAPPLTTAATTSVPSETINRDSKNFDKQLEEKEAEVEIHTATNDAAVSGIDPFNHSTHSNNSNNNKNSAANPMELLNTTTSKTYVRLANRTRQQQLLSFPHGCLIIFVGIHATSNQWTLATIRDFLASLGDDDYENRYLTIFTLLTPVSLLGLPMVDYVIHNYGYYIALQSVNVLGIGYMLVRLCSNNLNVQIIGFVIFAIFRCFLYSTFQSLVPIIFSTDLVGFVTGILIGVPGMTAFLNIPLASYTIQSADGNFFVANLIYTLLIIPCILATYGIGRTIQNEKQQSSTLYR